MNWKVGEAKQQLSEVVKAAAEEPQWIFKRDRLVAAVVGGEALARLQRERRFSASASIGDHFAELRRIAAEEGGWELPVAVREDRPNAFAESDHDDLPLRHQRSR